MSKGFKTYPPRALTRKQIIKIQTKRAERDREFMKNLEQELIELLFQDLKDGDTLYMRVPDGWRRFYLARGRWK